MVEALLENRVSIQRTLVVLLFLFSWVRGSGPERASSAILLAMVAVHVVIYDIIGLTSDYSAFDLPIFAVDAIGLAALLAVALKANRFYPLVLAAAQLVAFSSHLVRAMVEPVSSLAFYLLYAMPFWFQIFILAIGVVRHVNRAALLGEYRDWRGLLPLSLRSSFG